MENTEASKKNKKLAVILGIVAASFYLGFVLMHSF